jgi:hypothetical protein
MHILISFHDKLEILSFKQKTKTKRLHYISFSRVSKLKYLDRKIKIVLTNVTGAAYRLVCTCCIKAK